MSAHCHPSVTRADRGSACACRTTAVGENMANHALCLQLSIQLHGPKQLKGPGNPVLSWPREQRASNIWMNSSNDSTPYRSLPCKQTPTLGSSQVPRPPRSLPDSYFHPGQHCTCCFARVLSPPLHRVL